MLLVQDPLQLLQGVVQSDLLERGVGGLLDRVVGLDLIPKQLGLQAAQSSDAANFAEK